MSNALLFNQAEVELNREDGTGTPIVISLTENAGSFVGTQDQLQPGFWLVQLRVLHSSQAPPMVNAGAPARVEVLPAATANVTFLVGHDVTDPVFRGVGITQIGVPSMTLTAGATINIWVGAANGTPPYTLTGSAPSAAGFFGVSLDNVNIPFTAGSTAGTYPLTISVEDASGNTDSVIFDIEVVGAPGPGEMAIQVDRNPAPELTFTVATTFTASTIQVDFTVTARALGAAAADDLSWAINATSTNGPSAIKCAAGEFTVGGNTTAGSTGGTVASGGTATGTYTFSRTAPPAACDFVVRVEDAVLGTHQTTYRLSLNHHTVVLMP